MRTPSIHPLNLTTAWLLVAPTLATASLVKVVARPSFRMTKQRVLFVCIHNSARSQMAEAWLRVICCDFFEAESAGLTPGKLNPLVVQVMAEAGVDIAGHQTQSVDELLQRGKRFDWVVTVCDEASAERCPVFPGSGTRMHWGFPDPSTVTGTEEEKLAQVRVIRDEIRRKVESWCREIGR